MKKTKFWSIFTLVLMGMTSFVMVACDDDEEDPKLEVSANDLTFSAKGESQVFKIESNVAWTISGYESWVTVNPTYGENDKNISVVVKENSTRDTKNCTLLVSAEKGGLSQTITVVQEASDDLLTVDNNNLHFASSTNDSKAISISSNGPWVIQDIPDWLRASSTSGNGNASVTFTTISANNTSTAKEGTMTIVSGEESVSIIVTQDAGKPVCYVTPVNEVALYYCIAWEYEGTSNVNDFQVLLLSEKKYKSLTSKELLEIISGLDRYKLNGEGVSSTEYDSFWNRIEENSTYYIVTLAYDTEGNAGELQSVQITTPEYKDGDDDAYVSFENIQASTYVLSFDVHKEGYCDTYHLIYGALESGKNVNPAMCAFQINYYLKYGEKHWYAKENDLEIEINYPNNHSFSYISYLPSYPICFAFGWGVFKDGKLSSDIIGFRWDTSAEDNEVQRIKHPVNEASKNFVITERSEKQAKSAQSHKK